MKTPKTYRLSPNTIAELNAIKTAYTAWGSKWTDTDIIEHAISQLYRSQRQDILDTLKVDDIYACITPSPSHKS